ncbi:MAG: S8 family serine peptidase [Actinomycetota bacterium]|nr:S8 family serine peptidase [Actinomycetota bacterium]
MGYALSITWKDSKKGRASVALLASFLTLSMFAARPGSDTGAAVRDMVSVIVREMPGAGAAPERLVQSVGGSVGRQISLIGGFVADVPQSEVIRLKFAPYVHSVTPNQEIRLHNHTGDGYEDKTDMGSLYNSAISIRASDLHRQGVTGRGVDVAVVDTGVAPVNGLSASGKVVNGADLSFEGAHPNVRYLDTYGHGTHMAGIIAGRESEVADGAESYDDKHLYGIAPGARVVNVKVAGASGATDVSQVIAGIEWVVRHRNAGGLNVRVLNLSFGTDGVQDYVLDPLSYAVEQAWHRGVVVVVSAGNEGFGDARLNNPAYNPYVLAVGANDTKGTFNINDDVIPDWSSRGDGVRNPDVVAPGKSIVSLRTEGSDIDMRHPEGRVGTAGSERYFKGSGTSQAAAMVSGAAALMLQARPSLTPDQVKYLLKTTARRLPAADPVAQGAGLLNVKDAASGSLSGFVPQSFPRSTGAGSLDAARGTGRLMDDNGVVLDGERDFMGETWDGIRWSGCLATLSCDYWDGIRWSESDWAGIRWSGIRWSGIRWSGEQWDGIRWSGIRWSGIRWSGSSWE